MKQCFCCVGTQGAVKFTGTVPLLVLYLTKMIDHGPRPLVRGQHVAELPLSQNLQVPFIVSATSSRTTATSPACTPHTSSTWGGIKRVTERVMPEENCPRLDRGRNGRVLRSGTHVGMPSVAETSFPKPEQPTRGSGRPNCSIWARANTLYTSAAESE